MVRGVTRVIHINACDILIDRYILRVVRSLLFERYLQRNKHVLEWIKCVKRGEVIYMRKRPCDIHCSERCAGSEPGVLHYQGLNHSQGRRKG